MKIYKYNLELEDEQVVEIPKGGKILAVTSMRDTPCLSVLVNPNEEEAPLEGRLFLLLAAGNDVPKEVTFLGVAPVGGTLYHVFEATPKVG